jgi:hypothetical protein
MRIENEIKLDFKDVLIKPKRSTLGSRSEVSLERQYNFLRTPGQSFSGIPIIAANMDSIGTISMAKEFYKHKMLVALHKFYSEEKLIEFFKTIHSYAAFYTLGISNDDLEKFRRVYGTLQKYKQYILESKNSADHIHCLNKVCIDVANGYSERFNEFIKQFKTEFPELIIMAGNVVTGEMTEELILSGADIVKVGIGPGCFAPGTQVITDNGIKNIEDININDKVLTHLANWQNVTNIFKFNDKKKIHIINGIKCTEDHEFYVINKKYVNLLTDENIHQFGEWKRAKELDNNYLILEHNL